MATQNQMLNENSNVPDFRVTSIKHPKHHSAIVNCDGRCYACEPMARGISMIQCTLCLKLAGASDNEVRLAMAEMMSKENVGMRRCLRSYSLVSRARRDKLVRLNKIKEGD